ncbi:MAG: hypothetical protein VX768_09405 [Planctomycetota bacterium]|nr:hypothetical protein [Planctomycetota bacterium]
MYLRKLMAEKGQTGRRPSRSEQAPKRDGEPGFPSRKRAPHRSDAGTPEAWKETLRDYLRQKMQPGAVRDNQTQQIPGGRGSSRSSGRPRPEQAREGKDGFKKAMEQRKRTAPDAARNSGQKQKKPAEPGSSAGNPRKENQRFTPSRKQNDRQPFQKPPGKKGDNKQQKAEVEIREIENTGILQLKGRKQDVDRAKRLIEKITNPRSQEAKKVPQADKANRPDTSSGSKLWEFI